MASPLRGKPRRRSRFLTQAPYAIATIVCIAAVSGSAARADILQGKIVGPDGAPIKGATVYIQTAFFGISSKPPTVVATLTTDADGTFTTPDLAVVKQPTNPGAIALPPIYGVAAVYVPGYAATGKLLQKEASANVLSLEKAGAVHGIVVDSQNKPVSGVSVTATAFEQGSQASADEITKTHYSFVQGVEPLRKQLTVKSGPDGRFTISSLPSTGSCYCQFVEETYVRQIAFTQLANGSSALDAAKLIARPAARLTGRVIYPDSGKPAEGIRVFAQLTVTDESGYGGYTAATTAADGTFSLGGISGGAYIVGVEGKASDTAESSANPSTFPYVAIAQTVTIAEGKTTPIPDLALIAGIPVKVSVTESETGTPVPTAFVSLNGPSLPPAVNSRMNVSVDKDGTATLMAAPGKNILSLGGSPEGYLPESQEKLQKTITVRAGESPTVAFTLRKGLTAQGSVVDESGKPLSGIHVRVVGVDSYDSDYSYPGRNRPASDAQGKWSVIGLDKNDKGFRIAVDPEWKVVSPDKPITLPMPEGSAPLVVTLAKASTLRISGRVLTPTGTPLPNIEIHGYAQITTPQQENSTRNFDLETDKTGTFVVTNLRPEEKLHLDASSNESYKYRSGGVVTKTATGVSITDFILVPLTGVVSGRVVNDKHQPIAGAQVWSLDGNYKAHAITDATGAFTLPSVPEGTVTVTAAFGRRVNSGKGNAAAASGKATASPLVIPLAPESAAPGAPSDAARARSLLEEIAQRMRSTKMNMARSGLPELAAQFDPALALTYGTGTDGRIVDGVRASIVEAVIKLHPERAADWGVAQLALTQNSLVRCRVGAELGLALVKINPTLAASLYAGAVKDGEGGNAVDINRARLVALAVMLRNGDAPAQMERLKTALDDPKEENYRTRCAMMISRADPALAETLLLPNAKADDRLSLYETAVRNQVKISPLIAQTYLEKYRAAAKEPDVASYWREETLGSLTQRVIKAIGPNDPAAALALARQMPDGDAKVWALALAATFQSKTTAGTIWKEAASQIQSQQQWSQDPAMVRLAAFGAPYAPEFARDLWQQVRTRVNSQAYLGNGAESFAFYAATFDPAMARMVAERTYSQYGNTPPGGEASYQMAMAAISLARIDIDRSMALLAAMPSHLEDSNGNGGDGTLYLRMSLVRFLMLPPDQRIQHSFDSLMQGSVDDL